jgi:hypothetical protein
MTLTERIGRPLSQQPAGLLAHEDIAGSPTPQAAIFRQCCESFDAFEAWMRASPHIDWWKEFLSDPRGTEFWHEAYFVRGGMEATYDNVQQKTGFMLFAPLVEARGPMFSSRRRLGLHGDSPDVKGATEQELYRHSL